MHATHADTHTRTHTHDTCAHTHTYTHATGGWLEFLGHVRLRDDEAFDRSAELERAETAAADAVVLSDVSAAIEAAAAKAAAASTAPAVTAAAAAAAGTGGGRGGSGGDAAAAAARVELPQSAVAALCPGVVRVGACVRGCVVRRRARACV
jgi:hypothetical protein